MFGDANKTKEFKKLDEINGVKVKGRGYIANNGELAGEFFSPYVPLDQGFSFYDVYSKISHHGVWRRRILSIWRI